MLRLIRWPRKKFEWNLGWVFMALVVGCTPVAAPTPALAVTDALSTKWLDVSIGPETVAWFNANAQSNDIARIDHTNMLNLLEGLTTGRRLVVIKTIPEAEQVLAGFSDQIDIIGYNLEHGPGNEPTEQADPVGSTQRMRALADRYGVKLAVGPDRAFALSDGVAMASYADMLILQVQRVQDQPSTVREFVLPLVASVRNLAPTIEIGVQVGADGDVDGIISLLRSMEEQIDGISILTDHVSTDFLDLFLTEVRSPQIPTATVPLIVTPAMFETLTPGVTTEVITPKVGTTALPIPLNSASISESLSRSINAAQPIPSALATEKGVRAETAAVGPLAFVWASAVLAGIVASSLIITILLYLWPRQKKS